MARITKAESEANETAFNYMQRCEQYEKRINAFLEVTEISNKEHNKKNARIAELEQALRELKKENELLRADCVSFAKFLNSGQLISQYIDKLIAKYIGE